MEYTYYSSSYVTETQRKTAMIMAIIGLLLGIGVCIYTGISLFSDSSINLFGVIIAPFKSENSNSDSSALITLLSSLLLLVVIICFVFPATTIVLAIIVLATKGYKKTATTVLYVFMALTLVFFVQSVIKITK